MNKSRAAGAVYGGVTALVGAVLVGLAYYLLPVVSVPFVGSITAPTLAGLAPDASSLVLMPLVPIVAVVAIVLSVWMVAAKPSRQLHRIGAIALLACAAVVLLAYLVPLLRLQSELTESGVSALDVDATTFTGTGFWVAVIGAVVIAAGGLVQLTGARSGKPARV